MSCTATVMMRFLLVAMPVSMSTKDIGMATSNGLMLIYTAAVTSSVKQCIDECYRDWQGYRDWQRNFNSLCQCKQAQRR